MKKNIGNIDRNIRIIAGILLLAAGTFIQMQTGWRIGLFAVASIAFATAFINF